MPDTQGKRQMQRAPEPTGGAPARCQAPASGPCVPSLANCEGCPGCPKNERLLAAITSIMIGLDEAGRVTRWNATAASTFGLDAEAMMHRPLGECPIRWNWTEVLAEAGGFPTEGKVRRLGDIRFTRPDGSPGILGLTFHRMADDAGTTHGFLVLGVDVTRRRMMETQLAQAQKLEAVGQLATGIAHEINTPTQYVGDNVRFLSDGFRDLLAALTPCRQLLEEAGGGALDPARVSQAKAALDQADLDYLLEEVPKAIQQSLEGIERVTRIVRAMKEFSHPGEEAKTDVNLNHAIESTATICHNEWKYVADLETDFDPDLPPVRCLPGDLNQVVLNLLVNAAHAIGAVVGKQGTTKGRITVRTRQEGDYVEIRISDTGCGIPEEIRPRIFDLFFTTKEVGKGTGQGLAIARAVVVEKHGGTIDFESTLGRGTTFIIRLPLKGEAVAPTQALAEAVHA